MWDFEPYKLDIMFVSGILLSGLLGIAAASSAPGARLTNTARDTPSSQRAYWYETIKHNGISPFIANGDKWMVHRNVKTHFGAVGDGKADDTDAIQAALNFGNGTEYRNSSAWGTTGAPAVVYIPQGTYRITRPIYNYVDTVIMGDPINKPVLKAADTWSDKNKFFLYGHDYNYDSTVNFYIGLKNIVLDSTLVPASQNITLLNWAVSQNVQLANVVFNMADKGTGHTGLSMPEGGSPLIMNNLVFQGGSVGVRMNEQQYHFKDLSFKNMDIGLKLDKLFEGTGQGLQFESCKVGIETTNNNTGFFALIDSGATQTDILWNSAGSSTAQGSMVIENVKVDGSVASTVAVAGKSVLTGSVPAGDSWIWGNVYGPVDGERSLGKMYKSPRSKTLTNESGAFKNAKEPTFAEYDVSQVVNVKNVCGLPVKGDGVTDDTFNLQKIINKAAGKKVIFFPHGTYLVSDTLHVPPGSKFFGEAWSEISATGKNFADEKQPRAMVQVGNAGESGVAQFVDMLFTVADILPGCKLVEVNMAGGQPGDVGFFNTHFRIGGARGSRVQNHCDDPATCKAARMCAHLTATSSSYWENSWCWSADHDLDADFGANPSTGGGFLVEATQGTWLNGIGSEHNALYQVNVDRAQHVFLGFQQSETPYWQGVGSGLLTPEPWSNSLLPSDPDFSWCGDTDAQCRMAAYQLVRHSSDVSLYGGGYWTFFNGIQRKGCDKECQENAAIYVNNTKLASFGISTHNVRAMVLEYDEKYISVVNDTANSGGWQSHGGVMAAYLRQN